MTWPWQKPKSLVRHSKVHHIFRAYIQINLGRNNEFTYLQHHTCTRIDNITLAFFALLFIVEG